MLLSLLFLFCQVSPASPTAQLELVFELGEDTEQGTLRVALFKTEADFKDDNSCFHTQEAVDGPGQIRVSVHGLAPGTYAVAAYYDRNDNDKLDTNLFGIPKEPDGFTFEPKSKWRAPRWSEISTEISQDQEFHIVLKTWSER